MPNSQSNNIDPSEAKKIEQLQSELKSLTSDYRYEMAQAAVDAAGIVDPTPVSDIVGAGMSIASGDYIGAGLSLISAFPYVGDALGKSVKAARAAKRIVAVQKKIKKVTEALVAAEKRADKLGKAAAKTRAAEKAAAAKKSSKKKVIENCPPAKLGKAASINYKKNFFNAHPNLKDKVVVHHAIEQQALKRYPGVIKPEELHSLENLRGIPKELNSDLHLSKIRKEWNSFYKTHKTATKEELLKFATYVDEKYGKLFKPPVK